MNSTCNADELKPYPEMKDSGVPWIGRIPEHWETRRLGSLGHFSASGIDKNTVAGEPLVKMVNYVDIYKNTTGELHASRNYQVVSCPQWKKEIHGVKRGDLLFTPSSETPDEIGLSAVCMHDLADTVYSYHVIRFRPILSMDLRFKKYWCNNRSVLDQFSSCCKGTTRHILTRNDFRSIWVSVPPLPEQTAIGYFLDHADRRIRRYIRDKQKLIALLEEQKQAIIHQAVTGQIDVRTGQPYPSYKDFGGEWLEKVPACWDLRPAKWYFREVDDRSETGSEELLSVSHITGVTPRSEKNITMFKAESNVGYKLCKPGDLVINTMWAWMAALGVARQAGIVSPSYAVYRPHPSSRLLGDYTDLLLRTTTYKNEYICRSTGIRSSRLRLYPEEFLRIKLLCPSLEEQYAIVEFVSKKSVNVRRSIDLARRELSLLDEYRTRLIADVVTGKLDVREAAAELPEVDPLAEDDLDGTIHDGENSNLGELDAEESAEEYTLEKEMPL